MVTPSFLRPSMVAAQSAPVAKFVIVELPLARAAMIAARCEIDLSPGTLTFPRMRRAGLILIGTIIATCIGPEVQNIFHSSFLVCHFVIGITAKAQRAKTQRTPRRQDAKISNKGTKVERGKPQIPNNLMTNEK